MKLFIVAMLCVVMYLVCDITRADLVAENTEGGMIYLEEMSCPTDTSMRFALSTAPNATILRGCWVLHDGMYWVFWENGNDKTYPMYVFKERTHEGEGLDRKDTPRRVLPKERT